MQKLIQFIGILTTLFLLLLIGNFIYANEIVPEKQQEEEKKENTISKNKL